MNILFVTSTRIGDAVLSTGLLAHLGSAMPDCRITVACGALPAPLFAAAPCVVRVIELTKRPFAGHWIGLWARTVTTVWDLVVDLRGSALGWTVPARRRRVLWRAEAGIHRVEALGRLFGLTPPPAPKLWIDADRARAAARLVPPGGPVIGIGPTANWGAKIWPADRFIALLERLTGPAGIAPRARVAVFGGADERDLALPVLEAAPEDRLIDLVGGVDLPTAAACLARCALFVGNDSGLMHMAAAVSTPTLGLFGPSPPAHYAPWGPHCATAETEVPYAALVDAPDFDHRRTGNLMASLSVDRAAAEAESLWRRLSCKAAQG
jgi:ADP-heptose:LPS heptosyltransferase